MALERLRGIVGNVPVRLVATVLVAILVPSLLVTGLGLLAVYQADALVKARAVDASTEELDRLGRLTREIWAERLAHLRTLVRDAPTRWSRLATLRRDPYVLDVLLDDRTVPSRSAYPMVPTAWDDPDVRRLLAREAEEAPAVLLHEYYRLARESPVPSTRLAALLGAARISTPALPGEAAEALERAIDQFGDTTDETGVLRRLPLLASLLEVVDLNPDGARETVAVRLLEAVERERALIDADVANAYRKFALAASAGEIPESNVAAESSHGRVLPNEIALVIRAFREARRDREADGLEPDAIAFRVPLPSAGEATFVSFSTDHADVFVHVLLDREYLLAEADLLLGDIGIDAESLTIGPRGGAIHASIADRVIARVGVHQPFENLEWRYAPDPSSLPAGFRRFETFTVATFSWAVIVLVLTILVGTFLTLRSVLREMNTARMKSDFVSFVSHELKTPLSSIRMLAETLLDERVGSDADERHECLQLIDRESVRLTSLIDRVLEYSQIQNRQKRFEYSSCSMLEVVEEAVSLFREHSKNDRRDVEVQSVQHISNIRMDRPAMVELMLNLLSNADKYSPNSEKVVISLRESIDEITVEVIDRGVGIRKRDQRRIFEKFFRADDFLTRDIEGYGLGLAFARYIAREHKGDIRVSSQVNSGSIFTVCLKKTDVLAE